MSYCLRIATLGVALFAMLLGCCGYESARAEPAASGSKANGPTCNRSAFRLILDVGHTPKVFGATSARGQHEFDFNLRLAKVIDEKLVAGGFDKTMLLVTEGGRGRGLDQRVARANKTGADLYLSIHHDSVPDRFLEKWQFEGRPHTFSDRFKGHSIWVSHQNSNFAASLQFGEMLGRQLKTRGLQYTPHYTEKFMGSRQRQLLDPEKGVYRYDQLIVLKDTHMPAVLLEAGSIINRDEELAMETPERQGLIAASIVDAIDAFCATRQQGSPEQVAHHAGQSSGSRHTAAPASPGTSTLFRPR
jgi:N-acetylmuramoyl-L-alanine amidase